MLYTLCISQSVSWAVLVYAAAFVLAVGVGHLIVRLTLRSFKTDDMEKKGLKNAGAVIGILERALTLVLILAGEYTAIGLIFAAKSLARFKELEDRQFAEYYLIGTLSSILVTVVVGILAVWLLGLSP